MPVPFLNQAIPLRVEVRDVGLRDGLQMVRRVVPTVTKLQWIASAYAAGLRELEIGSFVPARLAPQLADTAELIAFARTLPGLTASVLVPNLRGAERAMASGADAIAIPLSASHAHSLANLRKTPDEVVAEIARIRAARDAANAPTRIEVGISTAFGCTIQGRVDEDEVLRLISAVLNAGVDAIGLCDTVGYANPVQTSRLFEKARRLAGERLETAHFHDTRGLGLANCYAALQFGIRRLDACVGGLGGCPHAPGASGNVATEDLAYMLASMDIETGLDFDALIRLRQQFGSWLEGEPLHGSLWRANLPITLRKLQAA